MTRLRRLALSAVATLAGWAAVLLPLVVWAYFHPGDGKGNPVADTEFIACFALAFVLATWVIVVAPLVWFVSARARLWHWPAASSLGAIAGGAILSAVFLPTAFRNHDPQGPIEWISMGALVGAITGALGAWLLGRFGKPRP